MRKMAVKKFCVFFFILVPLGVFAQVASATAVAARTDGGAAVYYDSLHEAFEAAEANASAQGSYDLPDEITLLADVVLDEPLIVADGVHIRLAAGGADRTIRRGGGNIEFPVVWVKGENSSLTLGMPEMEFELVIDGGRFAVPPVQAHAPIAAVSGPDAKLIMYDGVTIQNNFNNGLGPIINHYRNGAGVFIRTEGDIEERQAEFIMRGGVIRGNVNDQQTPYASGAGVLGLGFGIFTMEGGVIAGNTSNHSGGGFQMDSQGSFTKTGGIIYGKSNPAGLRNLSVEGGAITLTRPIVYGHALAVVNSKPQLFFRNDTVGENENLSYAGAARGDGVFGAGEKWDNSDKAFRRWLLKIIFSFIAVGVGVFLIITKIVLKRRLARIMQARDTAPKIDLSSFNLTDRENEVCSLLLTDLTFKAIAMAMGITDSGVSFHAKNLYKKLGIQSRTELFVKVGGK